MSRVAPESMCVNIDAVGEKDGGLTFEEDLS